MTAWIPKNNEELRAAIKECLRLSKDCSKSPGRADQALGSWDIHAVTDMSNLFLDEQSHADKNAECGPILGADEFNGDLSKWDVLHVLNMHSMFQYATSFNADISKWDVSSVTDMRKMFFKATSFNADLSKWAVSRVANMPAMFRNATSFNADLSKWDVSSVTNMAQMFKGASSFTQTLCGAWFASTADKEGMFEGSSARISRETLTDWP